MPVSSEPRHLLAAGLKAPRPGVYLPVLPPLALGVSGGTHSAPRHHPEGELL